MQIKQNISLKPFNTFGIDVLAKHFISIENIDALKQVISLEEYSNIFILGGGSNMLLTKDIETLVVHVNLKGISILSENEDSVLVQANAGENWHEFVLWCLEKDFGGLENLSLIPGNVGTAPIQNIGAYGIELKDTFISCEALHIATKTLKTFTKTDCKFDYRNSVFKQEEKGEFIICNVTFKLSKKNHTLHTSYGSISDELAGMNITNPTIQDISNAVIKIRQSKLPDPKKIGNSGSFFKNPVILKSAYSKLKENFQDIPGYPVSETEIKVPAGWLIEKAGFKGKQFGNYGVHKAQALVLVNYGNAKGSDILELSILIQNTIKQIFNITIEAEVNIL
ncbi:UDP-N-acetylmuramate dehydrogenase [Formosa maritima]|uniref:UDP-N-acetylenolpyruvoylglucosamine reductase n=1 Tax=Formosa maritima TaxID=2592046 RepID=A0A5D0G3J1_9FLAO|nr:UDP-N-acetylmuramate dehydrogenase [Formosa maritima]TYA53241.1 UDP-N-acetylmuramate dehydrogenase [Formosa maritima]